MKNTLIAVVVLALVIGVGLLAGCGKKQTEVEEIPPAMLSAGPDDAAAVQEFTYVCAEHADQTSDEPAKCPVCENYMIADTSEEVEYYCPHHEDVVQEEPGECEQCGGMILLARTVVAGEGTTPDDDDDDGTDADEGSGHDDDDDDDDDEGTA